jgi:hypothetical protein
MDVPERKWDCFISYASNDRENVSSLLANELQANGLRVWFDQFEIKPGMQLLRSINEGLANSKFGIVILSHNFFAKEWTQRELAGLYSLSIQEGDSPFIIPIWYNIGVDEIRKQYPLLCDIVSIPWEVGLENVVLRLMAIIQPEKYQDPDREYVKILSETRKALDQDSFIERILTLKNTFSLQGIARALEAILLNAERSSETRIRALETIYTLHAEKPAVVNQVLAGSDTDLIRDIFDLFSRDDVILSKEQIELLFANRRLPRHTTGLGNMIGKCIKRGAPYTSEVFSSGATYPFWEIKYDCVRTIVRIDDEDSLRVLAKFSTMSYWKARRTIIDYIAERLAQARLTSADKEIAKGILVQILSDGKSNAGTPTIRNAKEALSKLEAEM